MLIEHAGDNEFGGIALVLGPSPGIGIFRQLALGHLGRRWAALIYFRVSEVAIEAILQGLCLVIIL